MSAKKPTRTTKAPKAPKAGAGRRLPQRMGPPIFASEIIESLELRGFKSHKATPKLDIRPLTILAGENSGGKSSIVQPLLLMKQTLEAQYDPGVLDLRGACVKLDRAADVLWSGSPDEDEPRTWAVRFWLGDGRSVEVEYRLDSEARGGIVLNETRIWINDDDCVKINERLTPERTSEVYARLSQAGVLGRYFFGEPSPFRARVIPARGAHGFGFFPKDAPFPSREVAAWPREELIPRMVIERLIHLPGLRGNPERAYRVARVAGLFPGLFQDYTASVLEEWQEKQDDRLSGVKLDLASLRLTREVKTVRVDDTRVEVRLGRRLRDSGEDDMVNIADVGFGASQALPVVVALRAAGRNQLVHIEQPELHLHPNAQVAMADLLIAAVHRGARLIVETHSSVLLKALQLAVAEGRAGLQKQIAFHWFQRDESGASVVRTAELEDDGSFGDWPVDFADVEMDINRRFIEASARRRRSAR